MHFNISLVPDVLEVDVMQSLYNNKCIHILLSSLYIFAWHCTVQKLHMRKHNKMSETLHVSYFKLSNDTDI